MNLVKASLSIVALTFLGALQFAYAGSITVYTAYEDNEIQTYLKGARKALPDIDIHVLRLSTGEVAARLIAESNNPRADVVWGQAVTSLEDPRIYKQLEAFHGKGEDELPKQFRDANFHWFAPTGYFAAFCVNTVRLKKKHLPMPKTWKDLTNPVYKGEIVMPSPASSGTGYLQIVAIIQALGKKDGFAFLKKLNKNIAQYTDSGSAPCKMARRGEYTIGASFAQAAMNSVELGYPVKMVIPTKWVGYQLEGAGILKTSKNKADAKRFLDWALSPAAAKLYAKIKGIVTIPGVKPIPKMIKAGLPADVPAVLYPMDFKKMAQDRVSIVDTWKKEIDVGR